MCRVPLALPVLKHKRGKHWQSQWHTGSRWHALRNEGRGWFSTPITSFWACHPPRLPAATESEQEMPQENRNGPAGIRRRAERWCATGFLADDRRGQRRPEQGEHGMVRRRGRCGHRHRGRRRDRRDHLAGAARTPLVRAGGPGSGVVMAERALRGRGMLARQATLARAQSVRNARHEHGQCQPQVQAATNH
jgi:hypothetical protein